MENQEYIVPDDISYQAFNDITSESTIKREDLKDEYDIFLFAHLDNLTNNLASTTTDLPMVHDVDIPSNLSDSTTNLPQSASNTKIDKMPTNLIATPFHQDQVADENNSSHYIRYKLQGGKHVKMYECGMCSKLFTHQYTLMRHLPTHTDERKFQCITCGKAFRQMSTLSQHRAIHSTERPYVCEICQKTFNRVSTLISHRKTHTGLKPHRCHLCTKAFHQKGNLRNHIFTHTNERPYKCDICERGFNQMSNLMCHKLKAHQRTEKPKYMCQVCENVFPKRIALRQHEQYSHKIVAPPVASVVENKLLDETDSSNAIIVEPIKTEAMRLAIESNQTPFALLRPVSGIPVLVRVLPAGDKQMLVPATAEDLKKHSQISIMSKRNTLDSDVGKQMGNTVQIKIPVVATVIQQNDSAGQMSMAVVSPGPNGELGDQSGMTASKVSNFVYSSTLTNYGSASSFATSPEINSKNISMETENFSEGKIVQDVNIEFLNEHGQSLVAKDMCKDIDDAGVPAIAYETKDINPTINNSPAETITKTSNYEEELNNYFFNNPSSC